MTACAMSDKPRILVIVHQETSTPGRVGRLLTERGFHLDIRRPRFGDPLPDSMDEHVGAIIFGGPMSVNEKEAYIRREIDWIGVPLRDRRPFLGICLGAQMLVRHLGGRVYCHPDDLVEIGYYPIRPTESGAGYGPWPKYVYQWHREGFDLPSGATLLAEGDIFRNQALRYGTGFGIQFHPEVTLAMLHRWTVRGAPRLELRGAQPRADHFAGWSIHDAPLKAWLERFLDHWLAVTLAAAE